MGYLNPSKTVKKAGVGAVAYLYILEHLKKKKVTYMYDASVLGKHDPSLMTIEVVCTFGIKLNSNENNNLF